MSGNDESKNQYVENKIQSIHEQIDALEKTYGLHTITPDPDINDILNFSWNEIENFTPSECIQNCYTINQYLLNLKLKINRYKSLRQFCLNAMNLVISSEYKNFKIEFAPIELTRYSIIKNNDYANVLNKYIQEYETNIQSLDGVIELVQKISDIFKNMSYVKKQED
jgi:hypothetical protein